MDFKQHLQNELGSEIAQVILDSLTKQPYLSFRTNNLKTLDNLDYQSFTADFSPHSYVKEAFYSLKKLGNHPYHHCGAFYIQEASAMLVGELLPIQKNDKVLDLCAAPGGKASHVASKLNNTGLLIANDISYPRCKVLSENIERLGIKNAFVTNCSIDDFDAYQGFFDKVILDAPCSGQGMFRKNSLVQADWTIEKTLNCAMIQKELILKAYRLLKKGGLMIYSTCTFSARENEEIINYLLKNSQAELVNLPLIENTNRGINMSEALRIYPGYFKGEGHFICLIKCQDEHTCYRHQPHIKNLDNQTLKLIKDFADNNLTYGFDPTRLIKVNDAIYYLQTSAFDSNDLKTLRHNLLIGNIQNSRFIPAHALAMAASSCDFKNIENINEESAINKYLHGETFPHQKAGYLLVLYKGLSIGLAKASNGVAKNLYPKGLRK